MITRLHQSNPLATRLVSKNKSKTNKKRKRRRKERKKERKKEKLLSWKDNTNVFERPTISADIGMYRMYWNLDSTFLTIGNPG